MSTPAVFSPNATPRPIAGQGNGLVATQAINPGDLILRIMTPFVAVLDSRRLEHMCTGCFGQRQLEPDQEIRACKGCHVVKYCDKTCQSADWKAGHSFECAVFKKLAPERVLPINARAVLRMAQRWSHGKYTQMEKTVFQDLQEHVVDIHTKNTPQWERLSLTARAVKEYSGCELSVEEIMVFGCKLDINSFNMTTSGGDRNGIYLHPYAALMNHSCTYNAVVGFDGPELYVHALRPIQPDEQICISYVDATNPRSIRQRELAERYFFTCRCAKCTRPFTSTSSDEGADDDESTWSEHLKEEIEKAYILMEKIDAPGQRHRNLTALEKTIRNVKKAASPPWPVTKQPLVSLRDELIHTLILAGRSRDAFVHAAVRVIRVDPVVYPFPGHPVRMIHVFVLAQVGMHLSQQAGEMCEKVEFKVDAKEGGAYQLLERYEIKFNMLVWMVLKELVETTGGCGVPGFMDMVKASFGRMCQDFLIQGLPASYIRSEAWAKGGRREWEKLENLVDEALEYGNIVG